jgi:hypothetical protein
LKKIMALAMATSLSVSAQVADDISFYDIIVKGSLFRPLGWVEPNEKPKYKLIGTRVNDDGSAWAYMSLDGNRYIINALRVGNEIDGTELQKTLAEVGKVLGRDGKRFNPHHQKKGNA